ncbi:hypothetical protein AB4144_03190 [Rhizobiaceae sp. 2RAB30]
MNLKGVAGRIRRGEIAYALGRFKTVRATYSYARHALEAASGGPRKSTSGSATLFPNIDVIEVVQRIRNEAVFIGLKLPSDIVEAIAAFGRTEPLHAIYDPNGPTFLYSDVVKGVAAHGRPMPIGGVRESSRNPAVREVVEDPVLREIVRRYLGHQPRTIKTILDWSFASDMNDAERRRLRHHVIDYHYDVGGFNFVYASFYITDTDRYSGANVMMKCSHNKKPMRMLLGSAVASEEAVRKQYGIENEIVIEGPAGTGFVQDTSCYHRASPPTRGDRLMLAVRFIN